MFKFIKKADIVLFVVLVAAGLALSWLSVRDAGAGQKVVVTANGQLYGTYDLFQDQEIIVEQNDHINKITIKDGQVQMSYSDCKNQICVEDGKISRTNQSIVCLPNKVVVEITGGEEEFDAVAQ